MSEKEAPHGDPIPIGDTVAPAFARLPDPANLFRERAERFRTLAVGHDLGPYLLFLAALAEIQGRVQGGLPAVGWPAPDAVERAYGFGMPPLDRDAFRPDAAFTAALSGLLAGLRDVVMPDLAREALASLDAADEGERAAMVRNVLADAIPVDAFASHALVAAALQVIFAGAAARLDARRLQPVADGICPACGGPPVASLVVGWEGAHGARYCVCALCATLWNYVRIRCTLCGETKGIAYHGIEGDAGTIKAETCDSCRGYVKILHQHEDPRLDPVADDVATLALDLLSGAAGFRRGAVNSFLLGY
jgi:FdhE protein